ncbi:lipopolysaccharide heptosyltransferase family protein [Candidatus Parcubacteria bacterium]|nr:MAG: lipopolysaccharide heptosyltransferase family protein [Candidatus Parcubacteria bacterium]
MKILVLGINQLGGLMMATPFYRELRIAYPDSRISCYAFPLTFPVLKSCPYLDEVVLFNKSFLYGALSNMRRFDLVFNLAGNWGSYVFSRIVGKSVVGFGDEGSVLADVNVPKLLSSEYRTKHLFKALEALGHAPEGLYVREAWYDSEASTVADGWIKAHDVGNASIFAFNPFSTDEKRRWTDSGWKTVITDVHRMGIVPVLVCARSQHDEAVAFLKCLGVEGTMIFEGNVAQSLALLDRHVDFAMGVDSGFMHMALAASRPHVIGIFNTLHPQETFPIHDAKHLALTPENQPCFPCNLYRSKDVCKHNLECLDRIDAGKAVSFIRSHL